MSAIAIGRQWVWQMDLRHVQYSFGMGRAWAVVVGHTLIHIAQTPLISLVTDNIVFDKCIDSPSLNTRLEGGHQAVAVTYNTVAAMPEQVYLLYWQREGLGRFSHSRHPDIRQYLYR